MNKILYLFFGVSELINHNQFQLSEHDLKDIYNKVRNKIYETPCILSESLSNKYGCKIYLKLENLQKTGAFKIRGNTYKLSQMESNELSKGLVTASSGNHGLGLSLASKLNGADAEIFVPTGTPQTKINKIKSYGAKINIKGHTYDEAVMFAKSTAKTQGKIYIPSFDDEEIILGNSTLGYEVFNQVYHPNIVISPIGGGGGISGISIAREVLSPETVIYGAEAQGVESMKKSIEKGNITSLENIETMADGIKVAKPGEITFKIVKRQVKDIKTVSEKEMKETFKYLLFKVKLMTELAGTAAVASLDKVNFEKVDGSVVCIITGGNIDEDLVRKIL